MARKPRLRISLALQGGGAHGAFTWGVLDRLLEEEDLELDGLSGTSAGAMNGTVLADGYMRDGREGAREALARFWRAVSEHSAWSPFRSGWLNPFGADLSPVARWFGALSQMASPYEFNPLDINPLRQVLLETVDFERVQSCRQLKLFVTATNVRTNQARVFRTHEISLDALLASACLPHLHQAVEIDGEHYWDGGYLGNPEVEVLACECGAQDIVVVQINPNRRAQLPTSPEEIMDRVNEITFNASLMREIRSIAAMSRLVEAGELSDKRYQRTFFHMVGAGEMLDSLGLLSKYDTGWPFLQELRDRGRSRAEQWLAEHRPHLGKRSTLDFSDWAPVPGQTVASDVEPPPPLRRKD